MTAACGRIAFDDVSSSLGDADAAPDSPVDAPAPCTGPFLGARRLTEVNSVSNEGGGMISADGLELYFGSDRVGTLGTTDLYVATRTAYGQPFGAPQHLAAISTSLPDDNPFLESDGLTLWWQRGDQIVRSVRAARTDPWPQPQVVPELDSAAVDQAPTLTPDGLTIYFSSTRPPSLGSNDLWRATRSSPTGSFGPPVHEASASSNSFDCCPEVLPGGIVAFTSQRASSYTQVWAAPITSTAGALGAANLYAVIDGADPITDFDVFGTPDGSIVGMASNRPAGSGDFELWMLERSCP